MYKFKKLTWMIPKVKPRLEIETKLLTEVKNKVRYNIAYEKKFALKATVGRGRTWDWLVSTSTDTEIPRFVIVGFQLENKDYDKEFLDSSKLYNANLEAISVSVNKRRYPLLPYDINFKNNEFSRVFNVAITFKEKCFRDSSSVNMTPFNYSKNHPLFAVDVSNLYDVIKGVVKHLSIHLKFREFETKNMSVFAIIVSDKELSFQADSSKMRVIQ